MKQKTIDTIMDKLTTRARAAGYVQYDSEGQMRRRLNRLNITVLQQVLADLDAGKSVAIPTLPLNTQPFDY